MLSEEQIELACRGCSVECERPPTWADPVVAQAKLAISLHNLLRHMAIRHGYIDGEDKTISLDLPLRALLKQAAELG
jgi:hypothetical protein